jgi:hypothetical protein
MFVPKVYKYIKSGGANQNNKIYVANEICSNCSMLLPANNIDKCEQIT